MPSKRASGRTAVSGGTKGEEIVGSTGIDSAPGRTAMSGGEEEEETVGSTGNCSASVTSTCGAGTSAGSLAIVIAPSSTVADLLDSFAGKSS